MGHFNTLLVIAGGDASRVAACVGVLRQEGWVRRLSTVPPNAKLSQLELQDDALTDFAEAELRLQNLAREQRLDIVWIRAQSSAEAFAYSHWFSGRTVRVLMCGEEEDGVWSRVEGEPEEWEAEAFEGEKVEGPDGTTRRLGRRRSDDAIAAPRVGDLSVPPDAMKYARSALSYFRMARARPPDLHDITRFNANIDPKR